MGQTVDFYWDIGSTNTYFALKLLPAVLERTGATIRWRAFNLGYVFRHHDYALGEESEAKHKHRLIDLERWAKRENLPFRFPSKFPIKTSFALRGAIAMRDWQLEDEFIARLFDAYWERDEDVSQQGVLNALAADLGVDAVAFEHLAATPGVRQTLIDETQEGLERGAFGAPSFFVGEEMFWGKDRLDFLEEHLVRIGR